MAKKNHNCLLIVDMQNDFVDKRGSLYVNGADRAVENLVKIINESDNTDKCKFDHIVISMDSHQYGHVSMSSTWDNEPALFSQITEEDLTSGKVVSKATMAVYGKPVPSAIGSFEQYAIKGIKNSGHPITIWPEHCVVGTWGHCIPDVLMTAIRDWVNRGKAVKRFRTYEIIIKGSELSRECYSIFGPALVKSGYCNYLTLDFTQYSIDTDNWAKLGSKEPESLMRAFDNVYVCGVATDYCVAASVKDIETALLSRPSCAYSRNIAKLIFMKDCMATIDENNTSLEVYDRMIKDELATNM